MSRRLARGRRLAGWAALATLALLAGSCAFYNTFYFARKNYDLATGGLPYEVDKNLAQPGASANYYRKAVDYSKKLIANYPKSKWVDDAYLMWARSLLGNNDPTQTVFMLRDFSSRYPDSPVKSDATFFLGVAQRSSHKYHESLASLDEFLAKWPKHSLVPYAHLERARTLMLLDRPAEAAEAASRAVATFPGGRLRDLALDQRAAARLASNDFEGARADYHTLGARATSDAERFDLLLKEADCLEAGRTYAPMVALLRGAMSHEIEPALSDTSSRPQGGFQTANNDRWGRLMMRIGTAQALEGHREEALHAYHEVLAHYQRQALGAEAQFRIGYVYETVADDFETARTEYAKVKNHSANSAFALQASQRATNLERLISYRTASGDTAGRKVEGAFLLAEQYLFQLDKPDRAFAVYDSIAVAYAGTPYGGKALNAQAWLLRNKFKRPQVADSLLWVVVHSYPATEAQLAARDYLERNGAAVPDTLIKEPAAPLAAPPPMPDTSAALTPPPAETQRLGPSFGRTALGDSLSRLAPPGPVPGFARPPQIPALSDSLGRFHMPTGRDSTGHGFPPITPPSADSLPRTPRSGTP